MERSIEWAAGLFEGEGSIGIYKERDRNYPVTVIQLNNTDYDVIKDYADTLELKVTGPYDYTKKAYASPQNKPFWKVSTQNKAEVKRILSLLLPHLGSRRAYKALNALDVIECQLSPENVDFSKL